MDKRKRLDFLPTEARRPALIVIALSALLTWLGWQAGAVDSAQHEAYVRVLRQFAELEARLESEVLASRQELVRHFDNLAQLTRALRETSRALSISPRFLDEEAQTAWQSRAEALAQACAEKIEDIERFKREFAVLRNSLAWFPTAADRLLENKGSLSERARAALNRYVFGMLAYARSPSAEARLRAETARKDLSSIDLPENYRTLVENLLMHGDLILARSPEVDRLIQAIRLAKTTQAYTALHDFYDEAYEKSLTRAARFRWALYLVSLILALYLAWLFWRLGEAKASLARTHEELAARYEALQAAENRLRLHAAVFRNAQEGILITDAEGVILDVNPAFTRITGYSRGEAIGRTPNLLKSGRQDAAFYRAMWEALRTHGAWHGEIWNRRRNGEIYPELLSITAVKDEVGTTSHYVGEFIDIERLKAQEQQLSRLAYYDPLTELPNRALLADRMQQAMAHVRRTKTLLAVALLDCDDFKPINDTWGHEAGDRVLIEIASRLKAALRGEDTVARLGGDEFVLLMPGIKEMRELEEITTRVQAQIARPLLCLPEPVSLHASIGLTLYPQDDVDADTLLRHADQAMYRAKQEGKGRVFLFDAAQDESLRIRR